MKPIEIMRCVAPTTPDGTTGSPPASKTGEVCTTEAVHRSSGHATLDAIAAPRPEVVGFA